VVIDIHVGSITMSWSYGATDAAPALAEVERYLPGVDEAGIRSPRSTSWLVVGASEKALCDPLRFEDGAVTYRVWTEHGQRELRLPLG
jgi:hypothetical protein